MLRGLLSSKFRLFQRKIVEAGVELDWDNTGVRVTTPREIRGIDVSTAPFPGFPTDMQAQIMGMLCLASGTSIINEKCAHRPVYPRSGTQSDGCGYHA